jgi:uncharacterized protein (TIGR02757 family)
LIEGFDGAPFDFIRDHQPSDLKRFEGFVHRTFNSTDLLYFLHALKSHYQSHDSLEDGFLNGSDMEKRLTNFHIYFLSFNAPDRTRKHVASPAKGSTCKRLNMFLRWMVRRDDQGVDFGLWNRIDPADLMCPIDTHVARIARREGLLTRSQNDWKAVAELTSALKKLDPTDPVKYDFALFGLGVEEKSVAYGS